jgi:hypothetical protein
LDNHVIGIIRSNYINLREIMCSYAAKKFKKLIHVVECSYRSVNWIIFLIGIIKSSYIIFHEIMCHYEAINVKNLKQLV